jgi:hypothetical protein
MEGLMIRLALIDADGKPVAPKDITSAAELNQIAEQARKLLSECQRLVEQMRPKAAPGYGKAPYS